MQIPMGGSLADFWSIVDEMSHRLDDLEASIKARADNIKAEGEP